MLPRSDFHFPGGERRVAGGMLGSGLDWQNERMDPADPHSSGSRPDPGFATTHWSLVAAVRKSDPGQARAALEELCSRYWYPLYAWLRRSGGSHEDAQDLVQSFLLGLIGQQRLEIADPERGRFRSFLLSSLKNFRANQQRDGRTWKRGGQVRMLSLDFATAASHWEHEPFHELTPDSLFDRKWALQLIERSLQRVETTAVERGRGELFSLVKPLLAGGSAGTGYQAIADELKMSLGAVKVAVHRWREQLREMIRAEIRQTVASDADVDGELEHLFRVLAG